MRDDRRPARACLPWRDPAPGLPSAFGHHSVGAGQGDRGTSAADAGDRPRPPRRGGGHRAPSRPLLRETQLWLNPQTRYDLDRAEEALGDRLDREVTPRAA